MTGKIPKLILGIDTSCDETSAAILRDGKKVLSNIVSSQIKLHAPHGGVVPELASRSHAEKLPLIVDEALSQAEINLQDLDGVAVTTSPGLIGCLLVGLSYAKSLAYSLKIPLTCVHHLKAHLLSPFLESEKVYPYLGLVVSGGHTALYYVKSFDDIDCLGQTVDDAAGEAYDKVAKLLGLGYPGGPLMDQLAQKGDDKAFKFTRARVKKGPYFYSFSGLKTAVSLIVRKADVNETFILNLAASFQKEVVGALIEKIKRALSEYPTQKIVISGGVACNSLLRKEIKQLSQNHNIDYCLPSPLLCTDNGAMIAYVGAQQLAQGKIAALDSNAFASAPLW